MVLAGVGGLPAETLFSVYRKSESTKKINQFWADTGLGYSDAEALINNYKCYSSGNAYKACLNAVHFKDDDERSERERLIALKSLSKVDFNSELKNRFSSVPAERQALMAAQVINAFFSVFIDPHTYIAPTEYYNQVGSKIDRSKFFVGISYEKHEGYFKILKVSKNSDAELAGLRARDILLEIDGRNLKGLAYSEVSELLRNESAEVLNFSVDRGGEKINLKVKRSFRVLSHVQFNEFSGVGGYSLLTVSKFAKGVCAEVASGLQQRAKKQMSGLILDLRDNPGGQLDEAACVAGLFLGKDKKAYYVEYTDPNKPNELVLTSEDQLFAGPLVTLVNGRSASAAESLAGALKDYKRSLIVGRRTFGKGTFQEIEEWDTSSRISLFKTKGFYLLPSRNPTQLVGVTPDIETAREDEEKREGDLYYRPINYMGERYAGLKKSELSSNPVSSNCSHPENVRVSGDEAMQIALDIVACNKSKRLSQAMGNSTIN